jgi:signal transduction histidine kinase
MSNPMPLSQLDASGRRLLPVITVGPYVLLAVLVIFTVIGQRSTGGSLLIDLSLCALAAAWMLWMFTLHPAWRVRRPQMAVFFTVLVVIMAVMVIRDSWFGFFVIAGYIYAFAVLPWPWRLPGVAAVAIVAGTAQTAGVDKTTLGGLTIYVAVLAANVLPICGFAWLDWANDKQNDQRKQAVEELSEANRTLEATLAENAGLHEQLLTQAREAGALDERRRMAREIHDTLAQGLTGIITQLQAAEQASEHPAGWRRHVQAATRLARESLSEARRSVHELRPEPLETARLADALAAVAERWSALNGIAVQVTTTGTVRPVRPDAEFALLRTAQEALANVARHAHATRVGLTLSYMEDEVALDVRDDGRGFDPARLGGGVSGRAAASAGPPVVGPAGEGAGPPAGDGTGLPDAGATGGLPPADDDGPAGGGFGLVAMRQRIEGLSGTLQVESEPGTGTAISACVPAASAEIRA